jgi:hypothetical protein
LKPTKWLLWDQGQSEKQKIFILINIPSERGTHANALLPTPTTTRINKQRNTEGGCDGAVMELPFKLETNLERKIAADPEWQEGVAWGWPRPGHHEGQVMYHIADVLANVDRFASTAEERRKLRLIALIHDTLKYQVNQSLPMGGNRHAAIARRFAERYIDDPALLDIIELHDEAFNSWRAGASRGHWDKAEARVNRLIERLGPSLPLYVRFYRADNQTSSKRPDSLLWFEHYLRERGYNVPPWPEKLRQ